MDDISVHATGLRELANDFRRTAVGVESEIPRALAQYAGEIRDLAAGIAESYQTESADPWSGSGTTRLAVADSIHVAPRSRGVVAVEAGGDNVPLAGLWELGNQHSGHGERTFRHPTFGRNDWHSQSKHPYLSRAFTRVEPKAVTGITERIFNVFRRHRL